MSDLDMRARAIVEAGRDGDAPTAADRQRIKRAVLVQIAAGGALASTAAAGTLSLGAKAGLAVLALAVVGGGAVGVFKSRAPSAATTSPARITPVAAATVTPVPAPEIVPQPLPVATEDKARKAERPRKVAGPVGGSDKVPGEDQLGAEVEVLKRAREELRLRRPAGALDALAEYDRRFGRGALGEERQAIAAIATCQVAPGPAARAQAEAFIRKAPASPLRERVREACITPTRANVP